MVSLAQGAVAAAEAQKFETVAAGKAAAAKIEAKGAAEAEVLKARGDADAERVRAEGHRAAAELISSNEVAVKLATIDHTGAALDKNKGAPCHVRRLGAVVGLQSGGGGWGARGTRMWVGRAPHAEGAAGCRAGTHACAHRVRAPVAQPFSLARMPRTSAACLPRPRLITWAARASSTSWSCSRACNLPACYKDRSAVLRVPSARLTWGCKCAPAV